KRLHIAAARFHAAAFASQPKLADDLGAGHRYKAACAAALAAAGKGEGAGKLNDQEKGKLRGQALGWLKADLLLWAQAARGTPTRRRQAWQRLTRWKADPDLAGVRDQPALARLPEGERAAWGKLWAGVEYLLKHSANKK